MDISEVNFKLYQELKNFINEIKDFVNENHDQLNEEFSQIAPLYKLSKEEYTIILNRVYHLEEDQVYWIKRAWNKEKKKGLLKALEFAYIWQLKGGTEFLKRIKYKKKK